MTIEQADTPTPDATVRAPRFGRTWWQATAVAAGLATVINLALFLIARFADASLVLRQSGADHAVTAGGVVFSSVVPMTGGIVLAVVLALRWPAVLRLAQVIGGGLALLTVAGPVNSATDAGTRIALAMMHVVVGVAAVLALEVIRRRRRRA